MERMEDMEGMEGAKGAAEGWRVARTAEEAVGQLRSALRDVGVILPGLWVDPVSAAQEEPYALVDLGRCNLQVASRLAAALRGVARDGGA
ncbi:hypothetical protein ACJ6WF_18725 [Streptomyces sp. MMS24-I2-30]|uniref:hypothetical protein n=1 Tax=Streptomyces sp. MMS24-I2-30 TaxID=3351564 RepID=UPI0038968774